MLHFHVTTTLSKISSNLSFELPSLLLKVNHPQSLLLNTPSHRGPILHQLGWKEFLEFKHLPSSSPILQDGKVFPGWVYLPQLCLQSPSLLPDLRDDHPQLLHRAPVLRDARLPHPESLPQITHLQLFESWTFFYPGTSDCYWTTQFLAVQNSSIGDLVTNWLSHSLRTLLIDIKKTTKEWT